ncbi:hypothetical protein Hte_000043 [Hypoxylon texense]
MSTQLKEHEPLDGPKRQRTRPSLVGHDTPKRRLSRSKSDEIVPDSQESQTSSKTKHKSSNPANSRKKMMPQQRPPKESKTGLPQTPGPILGPAVKDLSKYRRKQPTTHLKARAASSPIKAPTRQSLSRATPKPLISGRRGADPKVAPKTPSRTMSATKTAKATTLARAAPAVRATSASRAARAMMATAMASKEANLITAPNNSVKTPRSGRQDPYEFPSDSEADNQPRQVAMPVKPLKKTYVSRSVPHSDPYTPAQIPADSEIVLLSKVSSGEKPGSRITSDSYRTSPISRPTRAKFPPSSLVISLDDFSSNEMPALPSPSSNSRLDSVGSFPPPRYDSARNRPNDKIVLSSSAPSSYSDEESMSEETPRKLELPPTTKAADRDRGMERTKQYVLTDNSSNGIWPQTADRTLNTTDITPFLAAKGISSPLSTVSQTTSALIAEQLMESCVPPPSNQELAALMSSSPAKQFAEHEEESDWNSSHLDGGIKENPEALTRKFPEVLHNQDAGRRSDTNSKNGNAIPQTTRVLRSRSTVKPNRSVQSVGRGGAGGKGGTLVSPNEARTKPPPRRLSSRNSTEASSKGSENAPPIKTNIVVELPALTQQEQARYDIVSPERTADARPTAIPKSFQEINGATSTMGEPSQDSDAEALNYVLRRSPQWLNSITGLDADSEAEKNSEVATQVSRPLPIVRKKTLFSKHLAHMSETADALPETRRSSEPAPLPPQPVPIVPAAELYCEDSEDSTHPHGVQSPKEEPAQKQQQPPRHGFQSTSLTNGDVALGVSSLPGEGEGGKETRKSPLRDDAPAEKLPKRKKRKIKHNPEQQQEQQQQEQEQGQHDASTPGEGHARTRLHRKPGRRARRRLRQEQLRQEQQQA